jgi:sulfur carrier protein
VIQITVNGEARQIAADTSVTGLIDQLGHAGRRIAVERNGEIVPKSQHGATRLADGDTLEIVVAVGGG